MEIIYKTTLINWALICSCLFCVVVLEPEFSNNKFCIAITKIWVCLTVLLSAYCIIKLIVNL